jgi:hypothetical protein
MFAAWALLYGETLVAHGRAAFNGVNVADDVRIVLVHFFRFADPELFTRDVIGEYHARGTGLGFYALYAVAGKLGDPLLLGRVLPYPLLLATLTGVFVATRHIAGKAAAFTSVALCLGTAIVMQRLGGGLPRAFAYPFLAWIAAALCLGRVSLLAVSSAAGGLFYPIIPVVGGLSLAALLLLMPAEDRGDASSWSFRRRIAVLALTLAASVAALVPFALAMRPYGATITPAMVAEFPETGAGGRPDRRDRPPFPPFFEEARRLARTFIVGAGDPIVPSVRGAVKSDKTLSRHLLATVALLTALGFLRLGWKSSAARRLSTLGAATFVGYAVADVFTPRLVLPQRYAQYAVPILVAITVPSSARGFLPFGNRRWESSRTPALVLGFGILLLCLFGGRGDPRSGIHYRLAREDRALFAAVRKLPKTAVVAGFPRGTMNDLPLATRRSAFLTRETHMPYHVVMTLMMRTRMNALIDAYFARDLAPLRRLRDEFEVTHVLVDTRHFVDRPPAYFEPFDAHIRQRFRAARGEFAAIDACKQAVVFRDGPRFLIDLRLVR